MQVAEKVRKTRPPESEESKQKRRDTIVRKRAEREKAIEDGANLEDGLMPMCNYTDAEGSRCMNWAEVGEKFCGKHRKGNGITKEYERTPILEEQLRSDILLQIGKWGKEDVPSTILMEWILEGLKRLMRDKE